MKKLLVMLCGLGVVASMAPNAEAGTFGIDISPSWQRMDDVRYKGFGLSVAIRVNLDDKMYIGYQTERLQLDGSSVPAAAQILTNPVVSVDGIFAATRVLTMDKWSADFGLCLGVATCPDVDTTAASVMPFNAMAVKPYIRGNYESGSKITGVWFAEVGYRFIPGINTVATPFGVAGEVALRSLNSLSVGVGVGWGF